MNSIASKGSGACTACPPGQFTQDTRTVCYECPSSKFSFDGWWCMTTFERLVFVGVWIASIISILLTIYKIVMFIKARMKKLREAGLHFTITRFLFLERTLRRSATDLSHIDFDLSQRLMSKNSNEFKELRELIVSMQRDIEELKNK